jgi:hypothetical protein
VTALAVKGPSFRVRIGNSNHTTDDVLVNEVDRNAYLVLDAHTWLIFQNDSRRDRTGFCCGEEII